MLGHQRLEMRCLILTTEKYFIYQIATNVILSCSLKPSSHISAMAGDGRR